MTAKRRSFLFPAPNTLHRFSPDRAQRHMSALQQASDPQHNQDPDGGSQGIMNHIIELKQAAEAHQLGQFNQHGIPRRKAHGLPPGCMQRDIHAM